jgi:hypothetical protein
MSEYVEAYEREKRRIEPFQQRPEWLEWMAGMDAGLAEFFRLVPDLPEDPWSTDGARQAEAAALKIFPDMPSASTERTPGNLHLIDPFRRFLGELMVRRFDGDWVNIDFDRGLGPAVRLPYASPYVDLSGTLTAAMARRTGDMWAAIVSRQTAAHAKWVEAGRPEPPLWFQMRDEASVS